MFDLSRLVFNADRHHHDTFALARTTTSYNTQRGSIGNRTSQLACLFTAEGQPLWCTAACWHINADWVFVVARVVTEVLGWVGLC